MRGRDRRHDSEPRPWIVVIRGARITEWSRYKTRGDALGVVLALRRRGFDAHVVGGDGPPEKERAAAAQDRTALEVAPSDESNVKFSTEPPEHNGDRRRFLIWALMIGSVTPEAVTQRIVADLKESAP